MLATLAEHGPTTDGWAWELKWDGIRALGYVDGGRIRLVSRNGNDVTRRYPELRRLGEVLGTREVVLDGEIVAFDESGRPSFELLQRRMHVESESTIRRLVAEVPVTYVLFDMLWHDGHSTMEMPYAERRARLRGLELTGPSWQTPPHEEGDGATTVEVSKRFGLEGIVAKRLDSRYDPGRRSPAWVKVKNHLRQEFVVGGWQPGEKGRAGSIGSLLVGYYDGETLHYAGKVGSGLSGTVIADLEKLFARSARTDSPFTGGRIPKGVKFVEPRLVVEVRFTEWTNSGNIRHPTFLGTRTDKDPRDVAARASASPTARARRVRTRFARFCGRSTAIGAGLSAPSTRVRCTEGQERQRKLWHDARRPSGTGAARATNRTNRAAELHEGRDKGWKIRW